MKLIPLTRGLFAKVDDEDYKWLMEYKWCCAGHSNKFMAIRSIRYVPKGTKHFIYMHKEILGVTGRGKNNVVDHIDGDSLNNTKENLRKCTQQQNVMNTEKVKGKSKYKGVSFSKTSNSWQASCIYNNKRIHLGYYKDEEQAAIVRDEVVKELYGEYAKLNFKS